MPSPPNWPPKNIPQDSVSATDIALRDHITYYRGVWDGSKNRFRDDQWEKIDATVAEVSGDRVILWSMLVHRNYKPTLQQITDSKTIRELWANEEERKPFAELKPWEPKVHIPEELYHAIAHNDSYERRMEKQGGFK